MFMEVNEDTHTLNNYKHFKNKTNYHMFQQLRKPTD